MENVIISPTLAAIENLPSRSDDDTAPVDEEM